MTTTPRSGWLLKLSNNKAFGSRWKSRFFVLLDSEMRYYKDEHSDTASRTINLREIASVSILSDNFFQLEPKDKSKVWALRCQSEHELDAWVHAIHFRLSKLNQLLSRRRGVILSPTEILSPKLDGTTGVYPSILVANNKLEIFIAFEDRKCGALIS